MEASQSGGTTHPSTAALAEHFDAAWPAISDRVTAVLRGRGVQAADVDDIVQEVAIRALRQLDRFTSDEHMVRWCCRVAINAHIDVVRRDRRVSAEPFEDSAALQNVAETVEGRIALDAALAQVAELSAEDRALLLHPPVADSRKEAVRLAVRRHRLRARLAAMLEGVLAGVPVLRRVVRSESLPVRAAVLAFPVVAVLAALPFVAQVAPGTTERTTPGTRTSLVDSGTRYTPTPTSAGAARTGATGQSGAPSAPNSRTIVGVHAGAHNVGVDQEQRPDDTPTLCLKGHVNLCVDRPGPTIPLPPLPLPAAPSHAS